MEHGAESPLAIHPRLRGDEEFRVGVLGVYPCPGIFRFSLPLCRRRICLEAYVSDA